MNTKVQNLAAVQERIRQVRIELAQLRAMERTALQVQKIRQEAERRLGVPS